MTHRKIRLFASVTFAAGLLAGCASGAPRPAQSAQRAESALAGGKVAKAVGYAEEAVLADPRNPGYRMLLGSAYMRAGRFESARQAYDDAMELGEDGGKVALSLALTDIALGHAGVALDTLATHRDQIPVADYGLALALAGQADAATQLLAQALRDGPATPKLRQNFAYALAMAGHWRDAREMVAQDVPADQVPARMAEWAQLNDPANKRLRVAGVLGVPVTPDAGQPSALALANFPATDAPGEAAVQQATADAAKAPALAQFAAQELPAVDGSAPQPGVADASAATPVEKLAVIDLPPAAQKTDGYAAAATPAWALAPRPAPQGASHAAPRAVAVHRLAAADAGRPAPALLARHPAKPQGPALLARAAQARAGQIQAKRLPAGTHVIQLGAFTTQEGARRAWRHYLARNAALKAYRPVINAVTVNGRQLWRTQAAGFASAAPARSVCGSVRSRGGVCIVLSTPGQRLPGAAPVMRFASNRR